MRTDLPIGPDILWLKPRGGDDLAFAVYLRDESLPFAIEARIVVPVQDWEIKNAREISSCIMKATALPRILNQPQGAFFVGIALIVDGFEWGFVANSQPLRFASWDGLEIELDHRTTGFGEPEVHL
ncbi:MAG TPA: hypothetical protein VH593_30730 [Ktedonobacteraceae bacterium]